MDNTNIQTSELTHKEFMKKYYKENREKILANANKKIKCDDCLHFYNKSGKKIHILSKKHKEGVRIKEEIINSLKK